MAGEHAAKLVISIDLELPAPTGSLAQQRQLDSATRHLLKLLDQAQVAATIAVSDPIHSAATELVLASQMRHEIGVLGDATWVGPSAGRERFARELERRVGAARAAGHDIRSLLLRGVQLGEHFDLLAAQAMAGVRMSASRHGLAQPEPLRLGIWQSPVSIDLPHRGSWWTGGLRGCVQRTLKKAACSQGTVHIAMDAGQFATRETLNLREMEQVVELAAEQRERGKLSILTLGDLVAGFGGRRGQAPMQSILRPAA